MNQVQLFRVTIFVSVLCLLVGGYALDVVRGEMQYVRYIASSIMLLLCLGTVYSEWMREKIDWIALLTLSVALYSFCSFVYDTDMEVSGAVSCFALIFVGCLLFRKAAPLIVWCFLSATCLTVVSLMVEHPRMEPVSFIACVAVISVGTAFLVLSQAKSIRERDQSLALSDTVFAQSVDGLLFGHASKGEVLRANKSAETMFGTQDWSVLMQCLRRSVEAHIPDASSRPRLRQLARDGWTADMEIETASGSSFWGNLSLVQLQQTDLLLARVTDMTDAKAREQQLVEARVAAEAAVQTRTQFLANMSHEIRTPMNGVIGMTSLLQNTQLDSEQMSYVNTIRSSGESLLVIINEILDFAKIEADEIELEVFPFDLERCVADAVDVVAPLAAQKDIELTLDLPPEDLGVVASDGARLRQVLVNLLSNAIKFTEEGEVVLQVAVEKPIALDPGSDSASDSGSEPASNQAKACKINFAIIDTGIGIPGKNISGLFEPFTQADASTTRRFGGTGLGLSICKNLVELMGGTLSATSQVGVGSTFSLHISAPWSAAESWVEKGDLKNKRVYAVDDNATNREVLSGLLEWFGMTVEMFAEPASLLAAYQPGVCDFVVTDMSMPDLDGVDLLNKLQQLDAQHPPVLLLTSLDRGDVDWNRFTHVLRKPVRPTDLYNALCDAANPSFEKVEFKPQNHEIEALEGEVVLVAEDNVVNQAVARQILKKLGLRADIASDGAEAVKMLSTQPYKLVFMDVQMPHIDGLEATQLIRGLEDQRQPYIVAMTANALAEDREMCLSAGMNDFVAKPVSVSEVKAALVRALDHGLST